MVTFQPKGLAMSREQENVYARTTRAGSASGLASQLEDTMCTTSRDRPLALDTLFHPKAPHGLSFYIQDRIFSE